MSYGSSAGRLPSSPPRSPDFTDIQRMVRRATGSEKSVIHQVEQLPNHLHRLYTVRLTDGSQMMLKCPPCINTRLLRHEQRGIETEAKVLQLLSTSAPHIPVSRFMKHEAQDSTLGMPYLLTTHIYGTPLSSLTSFLSTQERIAIDRSLGYYLASISSLAAPSYGTTDRVFSGSGCRTWREAFLGMLESVLRDAEDMLVSLPYDSIRYYVVTQSHLLDQVQRAQLVLLDAFDESKILVHEPTRRISGLLDFSHVVWGDPLMAPIFANPSEAFLEGYGSIPSKAGSEQTRQLLYTIYRSVVIAVTHHYRPRQDSDDLEARRLLTWALNQLASYPGGNQPALSSG